ncbi:glycosyltransferase [Variovorax dokdonensis]|uniref:Glycosyltransferase n=1 Tax=Variovorax dokdonensis TaxID=344883 RepID=A0ABT7N5K0_9BURK|nr:glycosyltransferase [Variovorax dokdonensis]MDM0043229.1 glycosyltransferase [Variovorax dokdonensis]
MLLSTPANGASPSTAQPQPARVLEALTACYNAEQTLPQTLDSAWVDNQIPVLLVDDGSTDGSVAHAERRDGVRVIRQRNAGPSVARNRAVLESSASFVMFLDSDDLLRPGFRQAFETALAAHPEADVFICGMQVVDEAGAKVDEHAAPSLSPSPFLSLLRGEPVPTNGIVIRRDLLARAGLFRPGLHHAEDLDLWLRLAAASDRWVRMDHKLAVYRLRSGSLSKNGPAMWRGIRQVMASAGCMPVGSQVERQAALRKGLAGAANYVYGMALRPMLRHTAAAGGAWAALREAARLPARFWPIILRDGFATLFRRTRT